jgi:hypothetical protein
MPSPLPPARAHLPPRRVLLRALLLVAGSALLGWLLVRSAPLHSGEQLELARENRTSVRGFYPPETTSDGRAFRWGDGYGRLVFAPQGYGPHVLHFRLAAPRPHNTTDTTDTTDTTTPLTVTVNQQLSFSARVPPVARDYRVLLPPAAALRLPANGVVIQSSFVQPARGADTDDPRRLGVALFAAEWRVLTPQSWLFAVQAGMLALACSIVLGALAQLRLAWSRRLLWLALACAALLGLGYLAPQLATRVHALLLTLLLGALVGLLLRWQSWRTGPPALRGLLAATGFVLLAVLLVAAWSWQTPLLPLLLALLLLALLAAALAGTRWHDLRRAAWWLTLADRASLPLAALLLTVSFFALYLNCGYTRCALTLFPSPPIRSDATGYYVYLPAALLDHDLTLHERLRITNDLPSGLRIYAATGNYVNKYPIGVAVLMLPFFLLAHLLALLTQQPTDGSSALYLLLSGFAGTAYALLGLLLLKRLLLRYAPLPVVLLTLACVLAGTSLYHYATYYAAFSHAFSFCLIAALLYLTPRWYAQPSWGHTLALGLVCGLLVLVRNTNLLVWLCVPLYGLLHWRDLTPRLRFVWQQRARLGLLALLSLLVIFPQLLYWQHVTGRWLLNAYGAEGFDYALAPQIGYTLFGIERGLFVWAPVLLPALPGLLLMLRQRHPFALAALLYLALFTYMTASWHDPSYGESFGHRAYVDSLGVLALPLAASFATLYRHHPRLFAACALLCVLLLAFTLHQTHQFWQGAIDPNHPTWREYGAGLRALLAPASN